MNPQMLRKIQKIQKEIEEAQDNISKTQYTENYQGISISMLGTREVTRVVIDPQLLDPSMKDMLEELMQVAVNNILNKIEKAFADVMAPYAHLTGGLGF